MTPPAAPLTVWFADLTYTQQTISSETMPAAVGGIAAFLLRHGPPGVRIRLFKYPDDLLEALRDETPQVLAFSNYVWNFHLGYRVAEAVKRRSPGSLAVFGGPNFPAEPDEQESFLRAHPAIDFYVLKEGEVAFAELMKRLAEASMDPSHFAGPLPSVAYVSRVDGRFYRGEVLPRIRDLSQIPSPYLDGLLDRFFDGLLQPIIQTNRGCPFECTFCIEGLGYYTKVYKSTREKVGAEIEYIARRMAGIRDKGGRNDLFIADSNFGMFREDLETCRELAEARERHRWPDYISVATGKNNRERVLEGAALLKGAMRLAGSVQSLTPQVLSNIKRGNISAEGLMDVALKANALGTNSYTEVIIALPGETLETYRRTLETVVDAGFLTVQIYQLMLLPGTEMATRESRARYGMRTRFRVLPRCYGCYDFDGRELNAAEIEEICIATNTFSYADYLEACRLRFFVSTFYDNGVFVGVTKLLKLLGLSVFEWLRDLADHPYEGAVEHLLTELMREVESELWEDREALRAHLRDRSTLQRYLSGELGSNLLFKYRALAYMHHVDEFCRAASRVAERQIRGLGDDVDVALALLDEIVEYHRCERTAMLDIGRTFSARFRFDVVGFASSPNGVKRIEDLVLPEPREARFFHSEAQRDDIRRHVNVFGSSLTGQTRMLAKVFVKRLFRTAEYVP